MPIWIGRVTISDWLETEGGFNASFHSGKMNRDAHRCVRSALQTRFDHRPSTLPTNSCCFSLFALLPNQNQAQRQHTASINCPGSVAKPFISVAHKDTPSPLALSSFVSDFCFGVQYPVSHTLKTALSFTFYKRTPPTSSTITTIIYHRYAPTLP